MSALERIAFYQNRRDEVPNQQLAQQLAETQDKAGIQEIAAGLWHTNKNVRSDCLKVLYEIGYIDPVLIVDYHPSFLKLLNNKDNRLVWGAMIGLDTIAGLCPDPIWQQIDDVIRAVEHGSVITVVWGVRVLAKVAAANETYRARLFPVLLVQLQKCIPRDVPTHAESMLCAVDPKHQQEFLSILASRMGEMSPAQKTRLKRVTRIFPLA
jgi:hypothetical protein